MKIFFIDSCVGAYNFLMMIRYLERGLMQKSFINQAYNQHILDIPLLRCFRVILRCFKEQGTCTPNKAGVPIVY